MIIYKKAEGMAGKLTKFLKAKAAAADKVDTKVISTHATVADSLSAAIKKIKTQVGAMQGTCRRCEIALGAAK